MPPPEMQTRLLAVLAGKAVPYTRPDTYSGIHKQPLVGPAVVTGIGISGDEQGDLRVHGGVDKAIHHYPHDHYPFWRTQMSAGLLDAPGAFGENLSTLGWHEHNVCFGDIVQAGTAVLQVSQGRQPCWKLNDRFGSASVARTMQSTGKTGWYYRVLQTGAISAGDPLRLIDRPYPAWPLRLLADILFHRTLDHALLESASQLPLPPSWMKLVTRRLASNQVESWQARLEGPQR